MNYYTPHHLTFDYAYFDNIKIAVKRGRHQKVKKMLDRYYLNKCKKSKTHLKIDEEKQHELMICAAKSNIETIKVLLGNGCILSVDMLKEATLSKYSLRQYTVVKFLLERIHKFTNIDEINQLLFDVSSEEIFNLFLEKYPLDINYMWRGESILTYKLKNSENIKPSVDYFIKKGIDVNIGSVKYILIYVLGCIHTDLNLHTNIIKYFINNLSDENINLKFYYEYKHSTIVDKLLSGNYHLLSHNLFKIITYILTNKHIILNNDLLISLSNNYNILSYKNYIEELTCLLLDLGICTKNMDGCSNEYKNFVYSKLYMDIKEPEDT